MAVQSRKPSGRFRCALLLHAPQVAERHKRPTSLVPRRPPVSDGGSAYSSQSIQWVPNLQSVHHGQRQLGRLASRAQVHGRKAAARRAIRGSLTRKLPPPLNFQERQPAVSLCRARLTGNRHEAQSGCEWRARSSALACISIWPRRMEHQSLGSATGMPHSMQIWIRDFSALQEVDAGVGCCSQPAPTTWLTNGGGS